MVEAAVGTVDEFQDGHMYSVTVGKRPVLLSRIDGQFYATGAHCTHYGAPLAKGAIKADRIVCPWHNACFNAKTGVQQEPPGWDQLASYNVQIADGQVVVIVPEDDDGYQRPAMVGYDAAADSRTFVVLGAGAAGRTAVETLRQEGFQGRIILITQESRPPYDRTSLSKSYLQSDGSDEPQLLRSEEFYQQHDIEVWYDSPVQQVSSAARTIVFQDGSTLTYDALLLATGGRPNRLPIEGADLKNVFTLRQAKDAIAILEAAQTAQRAVVIGSSFIGMETAASLAQQGLAVTVVSPDSVPFAKILGEQVGYVFQSLHEQHGVEFCLGQKAARFEGDQQVKAVVLENGRRIPTELVIVGIGVQPATDMLQDIDLADDGSVVVNEYLQAADQVYAAGDITQYPDPYNNHQPVRIEHWRLAMQHGRIAALNMLGQSVPFAGLPFFWTGQFDLKLRYAGHAETWDDLLIQGDLDEQSFLAFYVQQNQIKAVAGCGRDRDIAAITELMRLGQMPSAEKLQPVLPDWAAYLERV
ncbi:MAG: FAD-dependent oxidoreductase [Thainema sp.]